MFVESLVESTPLLRSRNRLPALISVAAQCLLVAALIAIPILHPEALHPGQLKLNMLAPPRLPSPQPPSPPRPRITTTVSTPAPSAPAAPSPATAAMRAIVASNSQPVDAPSIAIGTTMGTSNPALPIGTTAVTPNVVVRPAARTGPLNVSTGVIAGLLIAPIQPLYPQIARLTGTQGTVVIAAIISKTGHIESAHVVSGPAVLQASALDAVRDARYHPYLLNGEPTEVETTISINFRMGDGRQ